MLQVLCVQTELQEEGKVIAVGDHVRRLAGRLGGGYYGTSLDAVQWGFDRYAELTSAETAIVEGDVTAVAGVFVRLGLTPERAWTAAPGSAWVEPVSSTSETRLPVERLEWSAGVTPSGRSQPVPRRRIEEGDEYLSGWLFTLENELITRAQGPKQTLP